jgi:hypothetical protein
MECCNDKKFCYGVLVGFFLASSLLFGTIQFAMGPSYNQLVSVQSYAKTTYDITHSSTYSNVQAFVANVDQSANQIAAMPFIGGIVNRAEIPTYTKAVYDILQGRKDLSDIELRAINTQIQLIQLSLPLLLVSLAIVAYGMWKMMETTKPDAAVAKGKKKK